VRELPEWVSIGYINGAHGIKGELRVTPWTDDPQRFLLLKKVMLFSSGGAIGQFIVEQVRYPQKFLLLKLKEINTRTDAEALKGSEIKIPRKKCLQLPPDHYYHFELVGLRVESVEGQFIGVITDIMEMPANDVYVVRNGDQEILIPAIKDVIKQVDLKNSIMKIFMLDGLVD
jgi:16S rRNA processing protein RimM